MKYPSLLTLALGCFLAAPAGLRAEEPVAPAKAPAEAGPVAKLAIGDAAPEFKPAAWVQGEPVAAFEKDKVYLIECWATWCGPCVAQIPHLDALHKKYADKGLVVIGTNVWDKDAAHAADFVKKKGEAMSYRVAFDPRDGAFTRDYLTAAGVRGIPHAFIVRNGKIIMHCHPGSLSDSTIESMLAGTFDSAKAAKESAEAEAAQAKLTALNKELSSLVSAKDFDGALKKADELEGALPSNQKISVELIRARILAGKGDLDAATVKLEKIASASQAALNTQYHVAMTILNTPLKADKKAVALALTCAKRLADNPEHGKDAPVQKLLAAATKAVEAASGAPNDAAVKAEAERRAAEEAAVRAAAESAAKAAAESAAAK